MAWWHAFDKFWDMDPHEEYQAQDEKQEHRIWWGEEQQTFQEEREQLHDATHDDYQPKRWFVLG